MIALFKKIDHCIKIAESNENELDDDESLFLEFAFEHLIHHNEDIEHLSIPVFQTLNHHLEFNLFIMF